jgi:hypothetical protein
LGEYVFCGGYFVACSSFSNVFLNGTHEKSCCESAIKNHNYGYPYLSGKNTEKQPDKQRKTTLLICAETLANRWRGVRQHDR